jgi:hypothetical protein
MLSNWKTLIKNSNKIIYYFILIFFVSWISYIIIIAGWNTFCKECPIKWYSTNVHPYIPRPEPKPEPPIIEDEHEDWEDSEWE